MKPPSTLGIALAVSTLSAAAASAQLPSLPLGDTDAETIAAVEAGGATFPRDPVVPWYPPYERTAEMERDAGPAPPLLGDSSRTCVPVPEEPLTMWQREGTHWTEVPRDADGHWPPRSDPDTRRVVVGTSVRSGEFVIGGQIATPPGRPAKAWWKPLVSTMDMTLLLRGRRLGGTPADTLRFETAEVVAPLHSETLEPYADEAAFPAGNFFPSAGTWVVVATSRRNWGCFVISVQ
jgi:hypothetical protein